MKESRGALTVGFGAGMLGVLCCIGPLVPLLLGIGGASALFGLDAYRPWFIGAGALLLVLAAGFAVQRQRRCCAVRSRWKELQVVFLIFGSGIGTYAGMFYVAIPALSSAVEGKVQASSSETDSRNDGQSERAPADGDRGTDAGEVQSGTQAVAAKAVLNVTGMTCEGCKVSIVQAMLELNGVLEVNVDYDNATAVVSYDPRVIQPATLLEAHVPDHYSLSLAVPEGKTLPSVREFRVAGMTCAGCALSVKQAFLGMAGVSACTVNWQDGRTEVSYDPLRITPEELAKAPIPEHFSLTLIEEEGPNRQEPL